MSRFEVEDGGVVMDLGAGPIPLTDQECERLLDLIEPIDSYGAAVFYNALFDAHRAAGGFDRCTSRRAA